MWPSALRSPTHTDRKPTHSHTGETKRKTNTIPKNRESIRCNYFLLQLLFWTRMGPWWCFGASMISLVTDPKEAPARCTAFDNHLLLEVCWLLSSWNISVSSRYMCPQLACCLLSTDLGPTVIHTSNLPCPIYATLDLSFVSLFWLLFLFFCIYWVLLSFLFLSFLVSASFPLKAPWPPRSTRNLILKCPAPLCQQKIQRGRKWEKDTDEEWGSDNKGRYRMSKAKCTWDSCRHL